MNYTKFMEALKGKQKNLDKNHNGELDAHDFKLLRKEEVEELDEGVDPSEVAGNPKMYDAATVKKAYYHNSTTPEDKKTLERHLDRHHGMNNWRKPVKEETISEATVKTQKYSWGTMKTVHHGSDFSIPLHPEHHQAIAKLKDEQEHKFKDETGRHWTARRKGEDVHFQGANGGSSTKVPHAHMSEEVKDPTPVAPTLDKKYIKGTPENKALKASRKPINGHPTGKYNEEVELDESVFDNKDHAQSIADKLKKKHEDGNYSVVSDHGKHRVTHAYYSASRVKKDIKSLDEKLDPSMGAGEYIKDFQKSDAPQFAGKSKEKRRVMGIAAYLGAKRDVKEAVSPVSVKVNHALEEPHEEEWEDTGICPEHNKKDCHQCGKAGMKEQVEEIQEKSDQAKQNKTMKNVMAASKGAKLNRDSGLKLTPGDTGHSNAQQMNKALGRHAMRENEGLKSYKEFMMMLEYESDKSGSYTHKGSYGSEFAKKEREKDEKGFDSENEPAKRGPKMGSKRGPKANLGSSKLHTK